MTFEIQPERFALIAHHDHGHGAVILLRGLLLPPHTLDQVNSKLYTLFLSYSVAVYYVGQTFIITELTEKSSSLFCTRPILCVISKQTNPTLSVLYFKTNKPNKFFFASFFPSRSRPPPKDVLPIWFEPEPGDEETTTRASFNAQENVYTFQPDVAHSAIGFSQIQHQIIDLFPTLNPKMFRQSIK